MTMTDVASSRTPVRQPRVYGVAIVTVLVAAAAAGGFWLAARAADAVSHRDDEKIMDYTTVRTMAEHLGCSATLRPVQNSGSSSSAAECSYDGAAVEFRIYPTEPQALAWLEGRRTDSLNSAGSYENVGLYAGKWVVVIHSTDRELINRAMEAVQR
jgi:hypothetical protein